MLAACLATSAAQGRDYAVGQIWSYRTRPGEEASRILIDKIEDHAKLGHIFHISIADVKIQNGLAPGGYSYSLPHLPVSQRTMDTSVVALVGQGGPNPAFEEGYAQWKPAFDAGKAGIWTITLSGIVGVVEKGLNQ
ncbi:hypothetical protein GCM10007874_06720 [Labrys miyagiensis]|uniref:Uncharacterized protein n=1 Tax=Labrys miyagiensis TaxID=346912 RepID=A0ABQ6CBA4_9HYPH|nr:hypothetical protein [Labrys miyagiensis]GLS17657.1 hypothetical protein GCM10007874_06720 [Labrys miyagiensis]